MRMGFILLTALVMFASQTLAQGRYDANWVFGDNCGVKFEQDSVYSFNTPCKTDEACGSISDTRSGDLLFYVSEEIGVGYCLKTSDGSIINGSEGLFIDYSVTNGITITPIESADTTFYYVFHIGKTAQTNCNRVRCYLLYYTLIVENNGALDVLEKNTIVDSNYVQEQLTAIKHANGSDYFVITRDLEEDFLCSNKYFIHHLSQNGIVSSMVNEVGTFTCNGDSFSGETSASKNGDRLAVVLSNYNRIELFQFDRCTGQLSLLDSISVSSSSHIYGVAFSPSGNVLYVTDAGYGNNVGRLLQFDLKASDVEASLVEIWLDSVPASWISQLELGPNGKIYLSRIIDHQHQSPYNQNLGVVSYPDSLGLSCLFGYSDLLLADSSFARNGLPNMPNYNLGATSIYQADAGSDTSICQEDTTAKGVLIGTDPITGVEYHWQNTEIDAADRDKSKLLVNPNQSTWYYLELSDTSIVGSCQTRMDSVLVEVSICTGITAMDLSRVLVYPNPTHGQLQVHIPVGYGQLTFKLFSLPGKTVMTQVITENTSIDVSGIVPGVYLYQLSNPENRHQPARNGKLVVE